VSAVVGRLRKCRKFGDLSLPGAACASAPALATKEIRSYRLGLVMTGELILTRTDAPGVVHTTSVSIVEADQPFFRPAK
jgi:hypothetical protein